MHMKNSRKNSENKLARRPKAVVDLEPLHAFERALAGDVIWTTKDKRRIPVREMQTSHLHNTVRMLKGESSRGTIYICDGITRRNWIDIINIELEKRGAIIG